MILHEAKFLNIIKRKEALECFIAETLFIPATAQTIENTRYNCGVI
jgi:hypothetical protein